MLKKWCERGQHCTCFIDKLFNKDWGVCCKEHDEDYAQLQEGETTKRKDLKFLACLKKRTWKALAYVMYAKVRLFGRYFK